MSQQRKNRRMTVVFEQRFVLQCLLWRRMFSFGGSAHIRIAYERPMIYSYHCKTITKPSADHLLRGFARSCRYKLRRRVCCHQSVGNKHMCLTRLLTYPRQVPSMDVSHTPLYCSSRTDAGTPRPLFDPTTPRQRDNGLTP